MTLPVPGGILAQLAPAAGGLDPKSLGTIMALANNAGQPQNPGAAIAPAAIKPPTVAANALAAPAPDVASMAPVTHLDDPGTPDMPTEFSAPQHKGILGHLGDTLHDPGFRADALRFAIGAMSPGAGGFGNGLAHGLAAASSYHDQRRQEAAKSAEFQQEMALKGRLAANEEQGTRQTGDHYVRADANEAGDIRQRGILGAAGIREQHYGHQVEERGNIRSNQTSRLNNTEDNTTSRANTRDQVSASIQNNNADNSTARDVAAGRNETDVKVAGITSGAKRALDPKDALSMVGRYLPGALGTTDVEGVVSALQAAPELQAQLADAATTAYGDGSGNAEERVQKAIKGVLGDGASYTDDNSYIPFHGSPEITRGKPSAGGAGQGDDADPVVKTGTDKATGKPVVMRKSGKIEYR